MSLMVLIYKQPVKRHKKRKLKMQIIEKFSNVDSFMNYLEVTPDKNWSDRKSKSDRGEWAGTRDWQTAVDYAVKGWPEGMKKVTAKIGLNRALEKSKVREYDVFGERPEIGRFLSGVPVCMVRRVIKQSTRRPIVDIVINASYSSRVSADTIMNYGAAIAIVIDELEEQGFSVGLYVGAANEYKAEDGNNYGVLVDVKKSGEHMDLERMIFFTANPAFLRRMVFAYWETKYEGTSSFRYGYGRIDEMKKDNYPEDSVYFGMQDGELNRRCNTVEGARDFIRERVFKQRPDMIEGIAA